MHGSKSVATSATATTTITYEFDKLYVMKVLYECWSVGVSVHTLAAHNMDEMNAYELLLHSTIISFPPLPPQLF